MIIGLQGTHSFADIRRFVILNFVCIIKPQHIKLHFIVSTGRTGSTLLSSMLNMNPHILSCYEEPFAYNLYFKYHKVKVWTSETIASYCRDFFLFSEGKLGLQFGTAQELTAILEAHKHELDIQLAVRLTYLCFFQDKDKSEVKVVVDKQLKMHMFLEEMAAFYPEAKFIILYRDPRDNAVVKFQRAQRKQKKGNRLYYALTWKHEYGLLYKKSRKIGMERFLEVRYEDLVSNPVEELTKVCEFLGVPYHENMLRYDEYMKQKFNSGGNIQEEFRERISVLHEGLTRKVNTDKVNIWKTQLNKEQASMVWNTCADIAGKVGYQTDGIEPESTGVYKHAGAYLKFNLYKVWGPSIYFKLPFSIRYRLKKAKYRSQLKGAQKYKDSFIK